MQFLRKTALAVAATLLVTSLLGFTLSWGLFRVFGGPGDIKQALHGSGIYQSAVGNALDQAQKDQKNQTASTDQIPVNSPEVRTIIQQAFPPAFLQTQSEQVLDSVYAWLQGTAPKLAFSIDLTDAKTRLAGGVAQYIQARLSALPACTAATMPTSSDSVDPYSIACVPPGLNATAEADKAKQDILTSDFLKDTNLNADTIKTSGGKTLSEQLRQGPAAYRRIRQAIYGSGMIALILATAVVVLSASWRSGLRKVATIAITVGATSALFGWLGSFVLDHVAHKIAATTSGNQSLQQEAIHVTQLLANDIRSQWMGAGIALITLGIVTLLVLHLTRPKKQAVTPGLAIAGPAPATPPAVTAVPPQTPGTAPKPHGTSRRAKR